MSTTLRRFADRLHHLRTEKGLSQEALAAKAKLHPSYVSALERATKAPGLLVLEQLAKGLGLSLPELIDFDDAGTASDDRVQEEIMMIGRVLKKCDLKTARKARRQVQILAE